MEQKDEGSTGVENRIETFIKYNRKICWESEYEKGEFCIGENKVRRFCQEISSKQNAALIADLSVERQLVKVKQKEKECLEEKYQQAIAALKKLIEITERLRETYEYESPFMGKQEKKNDKSAIENAKKLTQ